MRSGLVSRAVAMVVAGVGIAVVTGMSQAQAAQLSFSGTLIQSIAAAARNQADLEKDPAVRAWLSEIEGFYRIPGAKPLWVTDQSFTANGDSLAEEVSKAYTYGLDNVQFKLPDMTATTPPELAVAEVELSLAAVKYVSHARGGRVDPSKLSLWLDQSPRIVYALAILRGFETTADAAAVLRSYHPHYQQFEYLRQAYLRERGLVAPVALPPILPGPKIALGQRHPDVELVRERLGFTPSDPAYAGVLDRRLLGAVREVMYGAGYERKNAIDDDVRREVSKISRNSTDGGNKALLDKMLVNLERWRLMPETMGKLHVWNNLPEYYTRVVKDGTIIHQEKIVIGTPTTQTPVFSDSMSHVIFQPEWGVPESIKIRQLLPRLKAGDYSVLERRNMKIVGNDGKALRSPRFNWSKVNIRDVSIVQGAGPDNPLGRLKFIFPNDHDVYMHDTPSKDLFETSVRTHSHGCIRVKNPDRFAEVILGETQGWTKDDVKAQLSKPGTYKVYLDKQVPVHNTYFTVMADAAGKVTSLPDMYGHDKRMLDALNGKSISVIASSDPALELKRQNKLLEQASAAILPRAKPRPPGALGEFPFGGDPSLAGPAKMGLNGKPQPSYLKKSPGAPKPMFFLFQYQ